MIVNKFPYVKLPRKSVDGVRLYTTPDGCALASVTTILDRTKPEEAKRALQNWRNSIGHAKAQEITTQAASVGTRMHSYLEGYLNTGELTSPGTNPYAKLSNSMAQIIIINGLQNLTECYASEAQLFYPELYAGTTDGIGLYGNELAIFDFKTTLKSKTDERVEDYKIQLAAYIEAHDKVYGTKINLGVILMCSRDHQFQNWEIRDDELEKYKKIWWNRVAQFYGVEG